MEDRRIPSGDALLRPPGWGCRCQEWRQMLLHTHEYKYKYKYTLQYLFIGVDIVARVHLRLASDKFTFQEGLQKWRSSNGNGVPGDATIVNSHLVKVNHNITFNIEHPSYRPDLLHPLSRPRNASPQHCIGSIEEGEETQRSFRRCSGKTRLYKIT